MAVNDSSLRDDQGEFSDWIEVQNYGSAPIDLSGWSLTDDPEDIGKWRFRSGSLAPGESLVVFASGRGEDSGIERHASFRLSAQGEYLALASPEGNLVHQFSPRYPRQRRDLSYGISSEWREGQNARDFEGFFGRATPGGPNSELLIGQVEPVEFSHSGGVIQSSMELSLGTKTLDAVIYFTTDGRFPDPDRGRRYEGPIEIRSDTVVRARGYKPRHQSSPVAVQSFLVVQESRSPRRPLQSSDLGIPIVSLSLDLEETPELANGLRSTSLLAEERPVSLEWLGQNGDVWQVGCGIRLRKPKGEESSEKPALRLYFRDQHGPAQLKRSVFGQGSASRFDRLELLPLDGNSIGYGVWDRFCHDLAGALRQPYLRGRFCHVFLNSDYLGVYELRERIDLDFAKSYFGGKKSDIDLVESRYESSAEIEDRWFEVVEGEGQDWMRWVGELHASSSGMASGLSPEVGSLVEVENFVAFYILSWLREGESLSRKVDWVAVRNREQDDGYRFLLETDLGGGQDREKESFPRSELAGFWDVLVREDPSRVRSLVKRVFAPGGALGLDELNAQAERSFAPLLAAMNADHARWDRSGVEPPDSAKQTLLKRVLERRQQVLGELKKLGLVGE